MENLVLFGNRVALNPRLGGLNDVTSDIISHEQIQSNRVGYFQTLVAVFPKDLFSDYSYLDIITKAMLK